MGKPFAEQHLGSRRFVNPLVQNVVEWWGPHKPRQAQDAIGDDDRVSKTVMGPRESRIMFIHRARDACGGKI